VAARRVAQSLDPYGIHKIGEARAFFQRLPDVEPSWQVGEIMQFDF
jgi:hypothetical protein